MLLPCHPAAPGGSRSLDRCRMGIDTGKDRSPAADKWHSCSCSSPHSQCQSCRTAAAAAAAAAAGRAERTGHIERTGRIGPVCIGFVARTVPVEPRIEHTERIVIVLVCG